MLLVNGISFLPIAAVQSESMTLAPQKIASIYQTPDSFSMAVQGKGVTVKVKGPDGYYSQQYVGNSGGSVSIDNISSLKDGVYHYEFTASSTTVQNEYKDSLDNGRTSFLVQKKTEPAIQSGYLVVKNGQIVTDDIVEGASK